ncbi:MAG TPA: hypothetical protein PKZ84_03885 [Anaerolineae bacterium]|nr:hypothetical protein [Anaerolineae bacterium]HQI83481.1 hypothetical protein [Anaerolineae bacterium]
MSKGQTVPVYQITVQGTLDPEWAIWLHDLTLTSAEVDGQPVTTLSGPVADQAGLRGILNKLWDLNLTVISLERDPPFSPDMTRPYRK